MANKSYAEYAELVRRYKAGDEDAFTEIYESSSQQIFYACNSILNNTEDAEEAMQETYLAVFKQIGSLENEELLLGWMKGIAAYKSYDILRKRKNNASYEDAIATEEILEGDDDLESLPEYYITEEAKREEFDNILKTELSGVQYQTILFHYFNEMGVEQIASLMECPEGTVKTRLKSARIKIKTAVEKFEKENGYKLAAFAGIPFMARFFAAQAVGITVPDISILANIIAQLKASSPVQAASHTRPQIPDKHALNEPSPAEHTTPSHGRPSTQPQVENPAPNTPGTGSQPPVENPAPANPGTPASSSAANTAAKTGFFTSTSGKVVIASIAVVGVLFLAGAGITIKHVVDQLNNEDRYEDDEDDDDDNNKPRVIVPIETEETITVTAAETIPVPGGPSEPAASTTVAESTAIPESSAETEAPVADPYSAPDTGWKDAYIAVAESISASDFYDGYNNDYIDSLGPDGTYIRYDLVFINDDNIPELVVSLMDNPDFAIAVYSKVYTYVNGQAQFLEMYDFSMCALMVTYAPRMNRILYGGEEYYGRVGYMSPDCTSMDSYVPDGIDFADVGESDFWSEYEAAFELDTYEYQDLIGIHDLSEFTGLL